MKQIVVTIIDSTYRVKYDFELPLSIQLDKLLDDILLSLSGCDGRPRPHSSLVNLYSQREKRTLDRLGTLESENVWNGDYLSLIASKSS